MSITDLPVVDPTSLAYWDDIHATLAPLRERSPIARSTAGDFEILRYGDCEPLLRDGRMQQALQGMLTHQGITSGPLYDWWQLIMNNSDPPTHTRLRSLVGRAFTPKQVERVRARIRDVAGALVDDMLDAGEVDIVATLSHELPLIVLCEMLGVPREDHHVVDQWTALVGRAFSAVIPPELQADIERAVVEFTEYSDALIERCRSEPGDDLLAALVHAEEAGDRLSHDELVALIINLVFAGHDTTKSLLSIGLFLLAAHPAEQAKLHQDPSLVPLAVEEINRYETPISGIPRICRDDVVVAGFDIPAGSYITLSVPSANRDPRRFEDPDRFDVSRTDNRHLSFGYGIHHCVGASIARAEVQEALAVVTARARLEPVGPPPRWVPYAASRRYESVPLLVRSR